MDKDIMVPLSWGQVIRGPSYQELTVLQSVYLLLIVP